MQNNRKVGEAQETRAVFELEKLGYKILEKNQVFFGELTFN